MENLVDTFLPNWLARQHSTMLNSRSGCDFIGEFFFFGSTWPRRRQDFSVKTRLFYWLIKCPLLMCTYTYIILLRNSANPTMYSVIRHIHTNLIFFSFWMRHSLFHFISLKSPISMHFHKTEGSANVTSMNKQLELF